VAVLVLAALLDHWTRVVRHLAIWAGVAMLVYPTVGALVVSRRPKNAVGYFLLGLSIVLEVQIFAAAYSNYARFARSDSPAAKIIGTARDVSVGGFVSSRAAVDPIQGLVRPVSRVRSHAGYRVGVTVEGHDYPGMPQRMLDQLRVDSAPE
jgi:hypothetical protein